MNIVLKPHQEKAVADFWERNGKAYFYMDVGTGKTFACLRIIEQLARMNRDRCLILVPANQHNQWAEKIGEYFGESSIKNNNIVLFNIEKLALPAHNKPILNTVWDFVAIDEAHALNNPTGSRAKVLNKLRTEYKLLMSATPAPNAEYEWWQPISFLQPGLLGKSFWHFKQDACVLNYFKGIERLRDPEGFRQTIAPHIIRVEQDVLELAPVKSRVIECPAPTDYMAEYHRMRKECVATLKGEKIMIANTLAMIGRLRQFVDCPHIYWQEGGEHNFGQAGGDMSPKYWQLYLEWLKKPCLIFVEFTDAITGIEHRLKKYGLRYGIIAGGITQAKRTELQRQFQAGELDVLIGTSAMAQGLNLQRAERIIHYSYPWNNARVQQRTGRAHRMGVEHEVEEIFLLVPGTIDEKIAALVEKKKRMAGKYTRAELLSLLDA